MPEDETQAPDTLGGRMRARRKFLGMTLRGVGRQTNISSSSLSKYERGEICPRLDSLRRIADALRTGVNELLPEGTELQGSDTEGDGEGDLKADDVQELVVRMAELDLNVRALQHDVAEVKAQMGIP